MSGEKMETNNVVWKKKTRYIYNTRVKTRREGGR